MATTRPRPRPSTKRPTTRAIVTIEPTSDGAQVISVALPGGLPVVWTQRAGNAERVAAKVAKRLEREGGSSAGVFA